VHLVEVLLQVHLVVAGPPLPMDANPLIDHSYGLVQAGKR
jgi:hypothetical protein